jgi:hypothetical protein
MYHRLDEYIHLSLSTGGREYEFNQYHLFYNDSPYVEKTIADEADYLLADNMANLKKIVRDEKRIYLYMLFFSKYVNPTSEAARIIVNYLIENKDKIDDANILLDSLSDCPLDVGQVTDGLQTAEQQRMVGHNQIAPLADGLIDDLFGDVQTQ